MIIEQTEIDLQKSLYITLRSMGCQDTDGLNCIHFKQLETLLNTYKEAILESIKYYATNQYLNSNS